MTSSARLAASISATFAITLFCVLASIISQPAQAQTYTVLHDFNSFPDGANPMAGLSMDAAGNLYGTTYRGGDPNCGYGFGCGNVFRLKRTAHGWVVDVLQIFTGPNGFTPLDRVVFGPDGALYGTASAGGAFNYGVIFRLTPPPSFCRSVSCPWTETLLYQFQNVSTGADPASEVLFDQAGNFYGTAGGGLFGDGVVYKMTRSGAGWTYSVIYNFTGGEDGQSPYAGLVFDQAGNLYGTTYYGGGRDDLGTVYELTPSGGSWQEMVLHRFSYNDGVNPKAGLIFDQAGNLYGGTAGAVFELTPMNGGWSFSTIYSGSGPLATLTMDSAGNLYGTAYNTLQNQCGEVFELSPQGGSWTYTTLHSFQRSDGCGPFSSVLIDANGNLFGTASGGGTHEAGVVWEITR